MIVAHEWGHYFHHRLSDCGSGQCGAMSEGWGDFLALHTALREGDNLDGTFAAAHLRPRKAERRRRPTSASAAFPTRSTSARTG